MGGLVVGATASIATALDVEGVLADPDALSIEVTSPSGVETTYVLGTDAELTQVTRNGLPLVGQYVARIPCTEAGKWTFVWRAMGTAPGVSPEGDYDVEAS